MSLKQYIFFMAGATLLSWVAFIAVIFNIDPVYSPWWLIIFFYLSFFMGTVGLAAVLAVTVRYFFIPTEHAVFHHVRRAFRHSLLLAAMLTLALLLLHTQVLTWWNALMLGALYAVAEGAIMSGRKRV